LISTALPAMGLFVASLTLPPIDPLSWARAAELAKPKVITNMKKSKIVLCARARASAVPLP
jgi:hypothetical protein